MARPMTNMTATASHIFMPPAISSAPMAPVKHTTEPTERSMLPPVRMQSSMPVARIKTYAFCAIRLVMFWGLRIFPPVCQAKNANTSTRIRTMVFFWSQFKTLVFVMMETLLYLFEDFRMQAMMRSCEASSCWNSPTIRPSFIT